MYFQVDAITPVYSDMDPVQAFLSHERLSAFMARDDSLGEMPEYGEDQDKVSTLHRKEMLIIL